MAKPRNPRPEIGRRLAGLMAESPELKTQQALEKRTRVAQSTIGRILRGEAMPSIDVADRLARALGSSVEYLANGSVTKSQRDSNGSTTSQSARLDPSKIVDAVKALRIVLGRRGLVLDLASPSDAEMFADAYAAIDDLESPIETGVVVGEVVERYRGGGEPGQSGAPGGVAGKEADPGGRRRGRLAG